MNVTFEDLRCLYRLLQNQAEELMMLSARLQERETRLRVLELEANHDRKSCVLEAFRSGD